MVNCTAKVYRDEDVLDHGHKASEATTPLWEGPAYLSTPTRSWEREVAIEGVLTGHLHAHTTVNLSVATRVVVANHALAGEYQVLGSDPTSSEWRLTLGRRPHSAT